MMPGGLRAAGLSTHEGVREIAEPSVLTNSGAYVVTRDLYLLGGSAISVAADDVTIDLNGHRVNSVGLFSPYEAAIYQHGSYDELTVVNGTVVGGSGAGILATGRMNCVKGVNVRDSARGGILLGDQAVVENCIVYSNTLGASYTDLVRVGQGSRVEAVLVSRNGGTGLVGIRGAKGCRVADCVIRGNAAAGGFFNGIVLEAGGVTESVVVRGNSGLSQFVGIGAGRDGAVRHGVVSGNRQTDGSGTGSGINAGENTTVDRCLSRETIAGAYAYGFHHFGQGRMSQCVAASNAAATQGFGFYLRTNVSVSAGAASLNSAVGFLAEDGCVIRQCVAKNNGYTGISLGQWSSAERCLVDNTGNNSSDRNGFNAIGSNNRIEFNHASDSGKGFAFFGAGNFVAGNSAINGVTNYDPFIINSSYGAITNKPGADFISTNPWQNFGL